MPWKSTINFNIVDSNLRSCAVKVISHIPILKEQFQIWRKSPVKVKGKHSFTRASEPYVELIDWFFMNWGTLRAKYDPLLHYLLLYLVLRHSFANTMSKTCQKVELLFVYLLQNIFNLFLFSFFIVPLLLPPKIRYWLRGLFCNSLIGFYTWCFECCYYCIVGNQLHCLYP